MENKFDILVLAGTKDARMILENLKPLNLKITASVTTGYGRQLLEGYGGIDIFEGRLTCDEMIAIIKKRKVRCLVDATHPYAEEVSKNAIEACKYSEIEYLRYERDEIKCFDGNIKTVGDFDEAAEEANLIEGNILLTTGSSKIEYFTGRIPDYKSRLFVRVLPESSSIIKCERLGILPENIIAMKGPFTEEMNIEIMKYCSAKVLITKESGQEGGMYEKLGAAKKLGIPVIIIERPVIEYPNKVKTIPQVLDFVNRAVQKQ